MICERILLSARPHLFLHHTDAKKFRKTSFLSSANDNTFVKLYSASLKHWELSWNNLRHMRMTRTNESNQNAVLSTQAKQFASEAGSSSVTGETEIVDKRQKVIVISGPTASGKTRLALLLAENLGGEIVSADSVQVYRGLDVGSAKTPPNERQGIRHHLLDIMEPTEEYSAGDFYVHSREATEDVLNRGCVPIVIGGTGLYLRWFLYGKPETPRATPEIVAAVEKEVEMAIAGSEDPWTSALLLLGRAGDATTAQQLSRNDWYRLKRALEIVQMSGRPRSGFIVPSALALSARSPANTSSCVDNGKEPQTTNSVYPEMTMEPDGTDVPKSRNLESEQEDHAPHSSNPGKEDSCRNVANLDYDFHCFFLCPPRMELYRRIDQRCEEMVAEGILHEAALLLDKGVLPNSNPPSRAIGYRQAMEYLQECRERGEHPTEDRFLTFLSNFQQASRNYAKRQMVWFRSEKLYRWLDASQEPGELARIIMEEYGRSSGQETGFIGSDEVTTKKRSYTEGKLMKTYRPELKIFSKKEMVNKVLDWVRENTSRYQQLQAVKGSSQKLWQSSMSAGVNLARVTSL